MRSVLVELEDVDIDPSALRVGEHVVPGRRVLIGSLGIPRRLNHSRKASSSERLTAEIDGGPAVFVYRPALGLREHWLPYLRGAAAEGRGWTRASVDPDLVVDADVVDFGPQDLITDPSASADQPVHRIDGDVLFEAGIVLERAHRLARTSGGRPVLWRQRARLPLVEGTPSGLRFDVLEPVTPDSAP